MSYRCHTDTSNQLINVSNRTRSTLLQSRDLSMPQPGRDLVRYRCVYGHPVQTLNINYVKRTANIYGILYNPIFITYIYISTYPVPSTSQGCTMYLARVCPVPYRVYPVPYRGVPSTLPIKGYL